MTTITAPSTRLHYDWLAWPLGVLVVFGSLGLARFGYRVILPSMQASLAKTNTQAGAVGTLGLRPASMARPTRTPHGAECVDGHVTTTAHRLDESPTVFVVPS